VKEQHDFSNLLRSFHAPLIRSRHLGPISSNPLQLWTSVFDYVQHVGSEIFKQLFARTGPMPLTNPLPRYRSILSTVVGGTVLKVVALNCSPCSLSLTHQRCLKVHDSLAYRAYLSCFAWHLGTQRKSARNGGRRPKRKEAASSGATR
jgi:hypothetical protein